MTTSRFSLNYNVRKTQRVQNRTAEFWLNLKNEIAEGYIPAQNLIQNLALDLTITFDKAVDALMAAKINAPCFLQLSNTFENSRSSKYGAGVVISKNREGVAHLETLKYEAGSSKWWIAATNMDIWNPEVHDHRYDLVIQQMNALNGNIDPYTLISEVLNYQGIRTSITIFSASIGTSIGRVYVLPNFALPKSSAQKSDFQYVP